MILAVEGTFPARFLSQLYHLGQLLALPAVPVSFPPALHIQILPFSEVLFNFHHFS